MKKFIFTVFVLAGLGVLGWQIYVKASIREVGNFTGSLYPIYEFVVAPKIAGRLEKMLVYIGDRVQSGQLLAVLDDEEYRQQVSEAKAELEVAQANLFRVSAGRRRFRVQSPAGEDEGGPGPGVANGSGPEDGRCPALLYKDAGSGKQYSRVPGGR